MNIVPMVLKGPFIGCTQISIWDVIKQFSQEVIILEEQLGFSWDSVYWASVVTDQWFNTFLVYWHSLDDYLNKDISWWYLHRYYLFFISLYSLIYLQAEGNETQKFLFINILYSNWMVCSVFHSFMSKSFFLPLNIQLTNTILCRSSMLIN